jgi:hypothetical protein
MPVIVDCSKKRKNKKGILVDTVCKKYFSKHHKKHRRQVNEIQGKYQSHGNKKIYRQMREAARRKKKQLLQQMFHKHLLYFRQQKQINIFNQH